MGLFDKIKDNFTSAVFAVSPQMKLKSISKSFLDAFGLQLVFYKGVHIADENLTLNQLNQKTTKEVKTSGEALKLKGSMKVGDAEALFDQNFGVTVQIKDKEGKKCIPNGLTIGKAARGEY